MDANELLAQEQFFYANCIVVGGSSPIGYRLEESKVVVDKDIEVDQSDLTSVFQNFSVQVGDATFAGGEAAAHGSCGYFYKQAGDRIVWILMTVDGGPFVEGEVFNGDVTFVTSDGARWIVSNDDVMSIRIKR
ncbi:hypothetical protein [Pseudomonas indica]|uniref:hypothetical protein n=1 Tax=Pseudomonas indica TaxID=137658 RepID=UPI003FD379C5